MHAQPPHKPSATLARHSHFCGNAAEVRTAAERTDAEPQARAVQPARSDAATDAGRAAAKASRLPLRDMGVCHLLSPCLATPPWFCYPVVTLTGVFGKIGPERPLGKNTYLPSPPPLPVFRHSKQESRLAVVSCEIK
jgi:hypothetical protein